MARKKGKHRTKSSTYSGQLYGSCTNTYTDYWWLTCDKPTEQLKTLVLPGSNPSHRKGQKLYIGLTTNTIYQRNLGGEWQRKYYHIGKDKFTYDSKEAHSETLRKTLPELYIENDIMD